MKIRGRIRCDDPRKVIIMERDYCWTERRHKWDTQIASIVQCQEYDCRQRGTIRLVSCELQPPCRLFAPRRVLGLQWDRYRADSNSATLLFETIQDHPMFPMDTTHVGCFTGIHIRKDVHFEGYCHITYILRLPPSIGFVASFLFDRFYMRVLLRRITLYEQVIEKWSTYYPDNGRVIR